MLFIALKSAADWVKSHEHDPLTVGFEGVCVC